MSLLDEITLWLDDHGIDTDPEETQAYYEFVNDDYLLGEFLESIYLELAARWDGTQLYPFSPESTLTADSQGNMTLMMPVFKRYWEYDKYIQESYQNWSFVPGQVRDYYFNGTHYYKIPIMNIRVETQDSIELPNLAPVLVVRRFIFPTLIDDMRDYGVSCHVYDDEGEVTLAFSWNCHEQPCPFDVSPLSRITVDDVVRICVPRWNMAAREVSVFDGDKLIMDLFAPEDGGHAKESYYLYLSSKPSEVPSDIMLKTYSGYEIDEMYRAEDDLDRLVMLLA